MNPANHIHTLPILDSRACLQRRVARAALLRGLMLILAWVVLWGSFVIEVTTPARGVSRWTGAPATGTVAAARSTRTPCPE